MIVYLAQDISAFVMYCIYGEFGSSLLIESTNSMILHSSVNITPGFVAHVQVNRVFLYINFVCIIIQY